MKTPTILLLCRRIMDESMPVLRARWFIIDRLPPCMPPLPDGSGWIWNRVFDELILILSEKNSLVHLRLLIRRCSERNNRSIWTTEATEEGSIRRVCVPLP